MATLPERWRLSLRSKAMATLPGVIRAQTELRLEHPSSHDLFVLLFDNFE
jgi:hypothetical protein